MTHEDKLSPRDKSHGMTYNPSIKLRPHHALNHFEKIYLKTTKKKSLKIRKKKSLKTTIENENQKKMVVAIVGAAIVGFLIWKIIANFNLKIFLRDSRMLYRGGRSVLSLAKTRRKNQSVDQLFEITAKKYPNKICFLFENEKWTYKQVQAKVNQVSNYFTSQGFVRGDHIGLLMENRVEFVCIWLGLAKIGVIPALMNYNLRLTPLQHCIKAGFCKGIIYGGNLSYAIEELEENGLLEAEFKKYSFTTTGEGAESKISSIDLAAELEKSSAQAPILSVATNHNDVLFYIYTSGTTGLPKAAIIKHSRYLYGSCGFHYFTGVRQDDIIYASLPLYHTNAAIFGIGQAIQFGITVAIGKKFSASKFWQDCIKHEATVFQYIGEVCRYLLAQPPKPEDKQHKLRLMFGNGLRPEIWTEFVTRFNISNVCEFYGSTEGNCNFISFDNTVGAVGCLPRITAPFLPYYLLRVDKDTGEILRDPKTGLALLCGDDEPGELVGMIRKHLAHSDFQGYTDAEARRKKIATDILKKGDSAFRSGDILVRDKFGYFYFKDRQGDTFRWKGENVSTAEVENVVSKAVELRDTAVYGVSIPGADGKAGMAAIVDPDNSVDVNSLATALNTELPTYARPLFLRIVKQLDMTGTYKFKKVDLQKEGFDVTKVKDQIYFLTSGKYVPLDLELFESLMAGKIRV